MEVLRIAEPVLGPRETEWVDRAIRSGWISGIGPFVDQFERAFADFVGSRHAVSVCNGTVALQLALHALRVGPGDEVIIPDLTFVATAHAALAVGATPVLVDVDPNTWCIDVEAARRALTPRTKAIIPVHLFGHPADMTSLQQLAHDAHIEVVEDAAEAHGAQVGEKRVGSMGHAGTFSFYANKIMTTGEGGAVVTDDDALAARMRMLKDHGMSKERRYFHTELAFNYRMTNLQAAVGLAQLERVEELIAAKRQIMGWYRERLGGRADLSLNVEATGVRSVFWMACIVLAADDPALRDALADDLLRDGIESRPFFVPMSQLPHLSGFRTVGAHGDTCPVTARLARSGLSLPSGCQLTRDQVNRVADRVASILDGTARSGAS